jgi:hypothetical protein
MDDASPRARVATESLKAATESLLMLNTLQDIFESVFGALTGIMQNGAESLAYIGVLCALPFILFEIISAMNNGGGANVIKSIGFRLFVLTGVLALITYWTPLAQAVSADFDVYAAKVAGINPYIVGDFTPNGIITGNDHLTDAIYANGQHLPFLANAQMTFFKIIAIACIQFGSGILAIDLLFANISMYVVLGSVTFLIGTLISPWLSSFGMEVVKIIGGVLVLKVLVGAFVGVGGLVATTIFNYLNVPGQIMSGVDMLTVGVGSLLFAIMATVVPIALAARVSGGVPIFQLGNVVGAWRSARSLF